MKRKYYPILINIICYCCILLFFYAAANKLLDYQKFKVQIGQSPILTNYAGSIAWFIPSIEIIIAMLLFFSRTLIIGLYATYILMVLFTTYIIAILNFTARVPCSCGGILEKMGWHEHLIFNFTFVIMVFLAIVLHTKATVSNP